MKKTRNRIVLIAGFVDDVAKVVSLLNATCAELMQVTESATVENVPNAADTVLYAISKDTTYSTQLHSLFLYIHDRVQKKDEYLVGIDDSDVRQISFPEFSHLPWVSMSDLGKLDHIKCGPGDIETEFSDRPPSPSEQLE
jgi:hypothetical protein